MVFKCRMVKPRTTNFVGVKANSAEEAAAITWHFIRMITVIVSKIEVI